VLFGAKMSKSPLFRFCSSAVDDSRGAAFVLDCILHGGQCEFDVAVVEVSAQLDVADESGGTSIFFLLSMKEGPAEQMAENAHNPDEDVDDFENFRLVHFRADFGFALVDPDYTLW
jgi:hypothetical protein